MQRTCPECAQSADPAGVLQSALVAFFNRERNQRQEERRMQLTWWLGLVRRARLRRTAVDALTWAQLPAWGPGVSKTGLCTARCSGVFTLHPTSL
ncbi:hypothetical protein J1614_005767 [Plenodomus biglobosus]|nr:hypothetical protein J1614_005767 [Plenodomus biglobosus]